MGFKVVGIDISKTMINQAKKIDSNGNYQLIKSEHFNQFNDEIFDLVLSIFTFDNIPTREKKIRNL
jgi:ubiquinone/menaquinone biosynthesis C-methylase UbiE